VIPALIRALEHKTREVQTAAVTLLGNLGPLAREAVPALQKWQKDGGSKELAVFALAQIDSETPDVLPSVLEGLANVPFPFGTSLRDYDVRASRAQSILGRLPLEKTNLLPTLVAFWPKTKAGGRFVLAQTFARFGPAAKEATPLLKEMLKDADEKVRLEAAKALAHVEPGSKEAFAVLLPLLEVQRDAKARTKLFEGLRVFTISDRGQSQPCRTWSDCSITPTEASPPTRFRCWARWAPVRGRQRRRWNRRCSSNRPRSRGRPLRRWPQSAPRAMASWTR
jgi:hypothetical protein